MKKVKSLLLLFLNVLLVSNTNAVTSNVGQFISLSTISYVDTTLVNSQKYTLMVDGQPFYMTSVQVRLDKLKAYNSFDAEKREKAIAMCAGHNFNTISIPLHWREVEPEKNHFDWTILDEYLTLCTKYKLKLELLWFSWSSGGRVQFLTKSQLRTPDYVCSRNGTSEFKVLRTTDPWTLDWYDDNLKEREKTVVDSVIHHVALWDSIHGFPHTVVGIQLGNEPQGYQQDVSVERILEYYSYIGKAIKESNYCVWTRLNCVSGKTMSYVYANEELKKSQQGSNIDFVGIDIYGTTCAKILGDLGGQFKKTGNNYMMIMESGAETADASHYMWAALRGGKAYSHYDFAGIDSHGLFDINNGEIVKHGTYVDDISNNNKIINMLNVDVARLAQGKSMYVYNYNGQGNGPEKGLDGIEYTPYAYYSHGLALKHSDNEYIIATTARATFTIPESIDVENVHTGHLDNKGLWIDESELELSAMRTITVKEPKAIMVRIKKNIEPEGPVTKFEPGKDWLDTEGNVINAHGGCVVKDGEYYYWIGDMRNNNNCVGISCYRSRDLMNWKNMGYAVELKGAGRDDCQDFAAGRALYRPKIAYCDNTGKWVLCVVWENDNKGDIGLVAFATADKPYGPYTVHEVKYTYNSRTRDQGIFKDNDGKLYYQACIDGNASMWNCLMTDDYLSTTKTANVILPNVKYEAPALFRVDETYFGLFSGCTGWQSNRSRFAFSQEILGKWKYNYTFTDKTGGGTEFCVDDSLGNTYNSQSAYVYKVDGDDNKLIYIGDRWDDKNLQNSKLIWLPISMRSGIPTVRWYDSWDMSVFDNMYRFKRVANIEDDGDILLLERNSNRFISRKASGLYIDNDNDDVNLRFSLIDTDIPYIYYIKEKITGKYLSAVFSSVRLNEADNSNTQKWLLKLQEDGTYIIENVSTGKCLTISGNSTRAGSSIYLDEYAANKLQSFSICFDSELYMSRQAAKLFSKAYMQDVKDEMEYQRQTVLNIRGLASDNYSPVKCVHTISGSRVADTNTNGIYIVTYENGITKKVMVK